MDLLKISITVSLIGIFFLLILSNVLPAKEISSYSQLKVNDYVKTTGNIISIKTYDDFNIIKLNNNITLTCNKCPFNQNQTIIVEGKVEEYENSLQINANKIKNAA